MKRMKIDGGGWFDEGTAKQFSEDTRWDGNNHISLATGSQWVHEILYHTAKGAWVLYHWSQWQGSRPNCTQIDGAQAAEWLITNHHDEAAEEYFPREVTEQEI